EVERLRTAAPPRREEREADRREPHERTEQVGERRRQVSGRQAESGLVPVLNEAAEAVDAVVPGLDGEEEVEGLLAVAARRRDVRRPVCPEAARKQEPGRDPVRDDERE